MAPALRKSSRVKPKELSKEKVFPNGKENARPSTSTRGRKLSVDAEDAAQSRPVPKIRVCLAPKNERNENVVSKGSTFSSVSQSIGSRRAPFSVHHDRKVLLENRREKGQPSASGVDHGVKAAATAATDRVRAQSPSRGEGSKIPRKGVARLTEICGARNKDECPCKPRCAKEKIDKNQLPSKIPRRFRSTSVPSIESRPRVCSKRASSVGTREGLLPIKRPGTPKLQKCRQQQQDAKLRLPRVLRRKNAVVVERKEGKPDGDERTRRVLLEPCSTSTKTPNDCAMPAQPSAPVPSKSAFHRSKQRAMENEKIEQRSKKESNERERFPPELYLQAEYFNHIPIVERRREESSPQLSRNFLKSNMNAEQRRLVVLFMIGVGSYYHYPSYVIYQAVKLFDAAMDRIPVTTMFIQMVALASLWIALKRLENFHWVPTADKMVMFAKELYAGRQDWLLRYERKILLALDFNITFADAFSLFNYHLINCKQFLHISTETTNYLYYCGGYLIDVTLLDEEFCRASAGLIAVTAAELALGLVLDTTVSHSRPKWLFWRGLLFAGASHAIGRFPDEEIDRSRVLLLRQLLISCKKHSSFEIVYRKYNRSQYGRISESFLERANRVSQVETFNP